MIAAAWNTGQKVLDGGPPSKQSPPPASEARGKKSLLENWIAARNGSRPERVREHALGSTKNL